VLACLTALAAQSRFPLMAGDYAEDKATFEAMQDTGITSVAHERCTERTASFKNSLMRDARFQGFFRMQPTSGTHKSTYWPAPK
jgi:hypothetical protein